MSWDLFLLKEKIDLGDKNASPEPLGNKSDVIKTLTTLLPALDYSNSSWGIFAAEKFSIEFNTGDNEIVDTIMLHVRGSGDPLVVIKIICDNTNWVALDCSTGEFIDTNNMSPESWERFQKYRDKIVRGT